MLTRSASAASLLVPNLVARAARCSAVAAWWSALALVLVAGVPWALASRLLLWNEALASVWLWGLSVEEAAVEEAAVEAAV